MQGDVLCRICLCSYKSDQSVELFTKWQPPWTDFDEFGPTQTVGDMLAEITKTEIRENDSYPREICISCFHQFSKTCLFVHRVRLSDRIIRKHDNYFLFPQKKEEEPVDDVPMTISSALQLSKTQYDNLEPAETIEKPLPDLPNGNIDIGMDVISEPNYNPVFVDKVSSGRESPVWKKEEELTKFLVSYTPDWINCRDVYTSMDDFAEYLGIKVEDEDDNSYRMMNGFHSEEMFHADQIKLEPDGTSRLMNHVDSDGLPYMETEWLEDFKSELSDSESVDNISQECMLCSKQFGTISGLKAHVISSHSYRTVFRMSVDSLTVEQSEKKPSYPADKWCKYCNIRVDSIARHLYEVKHTIKKCSWCESTFGNDRLLYTHTLRCADRHRGLNGTTSTGPIKDKIETGQDVVHRVASLGTNLSLPIDTSVQYKCKFCSESFVNSEYLSIHTQAYHSPGDDLEALRLEISRGQPQQT